jgi:hypothetical protein
MNKREITNQKLDSLFQDALEQPPIINEEQVNSLLYGLPKAPKGSQAKQFLKKHQNLWIMSTIISSIIVGTVLWTGSHSQNDNHLKGNAVRQIKATASVKTQTAPTGNNTLKLNSIASPEDNIFPALLTQAGFENVKDSLPSLISLPPIPHKKVNVSKDKVIHLSLDDFKKIGFVFTDSSVTYINLPKDSVWCYFERIGSWVINRLGYTDYKLPPTSEIIKNKPVSYIDYQPWYISDKTSTTNVVTIDLKKRKCVDFKPDSLIPIVLDVKEIQKDFDITSVKGKQLFLVGQSVFWFNLTPHLYSLLPDSVKDTAIGLYNLALSKDFKNEPINSIRQTESNLNAIDSSKISSSISSALVLSKKELVQLGFVFQDSGVEYRFKVPNNNRYAPMLPINVRFIFKNNGKCEVGIFGDNQLGTDIDTILRFNRNSYFPEIVSDNKGRSSVAWGVKTTTSSIKDSSTQQLGGIYNKLQNRANYLIPVLVKLNSDHSSEKDLYFWFTPTDEFFAALPEQYAKEIRNDYNIIKIKKDPNVTADQKAQLTSSCKYFDECKITLFDVNFNVCPNPTKDAINLELKLKAPDRLSITIHSIAGNRLLSLQPLMRFEAGSHMLNYSLASLKAGIYLVSVQNERGELTTQRVIKE